MGFLQSHVLRMCSLSDRSNGYNIKGGTEGRWRRQKGGACSAGDTSHWAKCHQHRFPLRHVRGCHYRLPVSLMLSPVSTSVFLSRGRNVHDSMCFEADYSNPFANSFHLFIADDSGGLHAREAVFNLGCLVGPKCARGSSFSLSSWHTVSTQLMVVLIVIFLTLPMCVRPSEITGQLGSFKRVNRIHAAIWPQPELSPK